MDGNPQDARTQRRLSLIANDPEYFLVSLARQGVLHQIRLSFRNNVGLRLKNICPYFASYHGHLNIVQFILSEYDGDANFEFNAKGTRPIHVAVSGGHWGVVKALIEHGASVNSADKRGQTPLLLACRHDQLEIAELLIDQGAKVNVAKTNGTTILHMASAFAGPELFQLILNNNACCTVVNSKGETPLMIAMDGGLDFIYPLVRKQLEIDGNLYSLDKAIIPPRGERSNLLQQRSIQKERNRLAEEMKALEGSPSEQDIVEDENDEDDGEWSDEAVAVGEDSEPEQMEMMIDRGQIPAEEDWMVQDAVEWERDQHPWHEETRHRRRMIERGEVLVSLRQMGPMPLEEGRRHAHGETIREGERVSRSTGQRRHVQLDRRGARDRVSAYERRQRRANEIFQLVATMSRLGIRNANDQDDNA